MPLSYISALRACKSQTVAWAKQTKTHADERPTCFASSFLILEKAPRASVKKTECPFLYKRTQEPHCLKRPSPYSLGLQSLNISRRMAIVSAGDLTA